MNTSHGNELARRDHDYWWFRSRYNTVERLLRKQSLMPIDGLLDFGCGSGGFLRHAVSSGLVAPSGAVGIDGDAAAVHRVRAMGFEVHQADASNLAEVRIGHRLSAITALDILEHLDEPVAALESLRSMAAPGASLVALVPAIPSLWSEWDERLGHRRRYLSRTLQRDLETAGWKVKHVRYLFISMLAPAWLRAFIGVSASSDQFPSFPRWIDSVLGWATSLENRFPLWPAGTSLAAVAECR